MSNQKKSILLIFLILLVDQVVKIWIKTHLAPGGEIVVFKNWFILHFIENNGIAFGLEFGNVAGKYLLSIFRLVAIGILGWYLSNLLKKGVPFGLITCFSLILAGAIGNMIDGTFYGMIFNYAPGQVAELFPPGGGYSSFLQGRVVDMFYFPIIETHYPDWFPIFGGRPFVFFRDIFNVADSAVTVGVTSILLFYRSYFGGGETVNSEQAAGNVKTEVTNGDTGAETENNN